MNEGDNISDDFDENDRNGDGHFDLIDEQINNPKKVKKPKRRKDPSPRYKANNRGGYGNPPVKSQFKPGNKGGPGRSKGVTNLESAMRKATGTKLTVTKNGKTTTMTPVEVFAERTVETLLSKTRSPRMIELGQELFEKYGPQEPEELPFKWDMSVFSYDEFHIFSALMSRAFCEAPGHRDPDDPPYVEVDIDGDYRVSRGPDGHIVMVKIFDIEHTGSH